MIFAPAMRLLEVEAKSASDGTLAYYHAHWTRRDSPLLDELGAVIDHIVAHAVGGESSDENLCTACNKCNGRKNAASTDRWDQRPKRSPIKGVYGEPTGWDGFTQIFITLAGKYHADLTAGERGCFKALVKDMEPAQRNRDGDKEGKHLISR